MNMNEMSLLNLPKQAKRKAGNIGGGEASGLLLGESVGEFVFSEFNGVVGSETRDLLAEDGDLGVFTQQVFC